MSETVGLLGLGLIGSAIAGRLLAGGYRVLGHDPRPDRCAALDQAGGESAEPSAIWAAAGTVIAAVFDTDQVEEVIAAAPAGEGCLIVVSTCDPARMPGLARLAGEKGLRLVDAPISGTSRQLETGEAVFLVGGDAGTVGRLAPLFAVLGRAHHPTGTVGSGTAMKLAVNLVLGLNRAALAEGLVLAERLGIPPADFLTLVQGTAAASAVMAGKGPLMVAGEFAPQGRIAQSAKDFALILDAGGQALPFARTYAAMMQDCLAAGEGELDNAAIIRAIRRQDGLSGQLHPGSDP